MEVKAEPQEFADFINAISEKIEKKERSVKTEPPKKIVKIGNEVIS